MLQKPEDEDEVVLILLQHYFNLLFATNFGINFVLYCISGQNFRKSLCILFRLRTARGIHEHTQATGEKFCQNMVFKICKLRI